MIRRIHHSEVFEDRARIQVGPEKDCLNVDKDSSVERGERITDVGSIQPRGGNCLR